MDDAQAINNNWSVKIIKCPLSRVFLCLCVTVCVNEQQIFIIVDDATQKQKTGK